MAENESVNEESLETGEMTAPNDEKPTEKMVPQSVVDNVVKHAKAKAYANGHKEALKSFEDKNMDEQPISTEPATQAPAPSVGGMKQVSQEEIQAMVEQASLKQAEQLQRQMHEQAQQEQANKIAQEFLGKMNHGASKYDDFSETVKELDLPNMPEIVQLANGVDNTHDVVYELAKNPNKLANLMILSQKSPGLAKRQMLELSNSITSNENALNQPKTPEPLSQINPSPTSTSDGEMTLKDMKKLFRG